MTPQIACCSIYNSLWNTLYKRILRSYILLMYPTSNVINSSIFVRISSLYTDKSIIVKWNYILLKISWRLYFLFIATTRIKIDRSERICPSSFQWESIFSQRRQQSIDSFGSLYNITLAKQTKTDVQRLLRARGKLCLSKFFICRNYSSFMWRICRRQHCLMRCIFQSGFVEDIFPNSNLWENVLKAIL